MGTISITAGASATAPSVTTDEVDPDLLTATEVYLTGTVTSDGGASVTDRGFCYKTSSGVTITDNKTSADTPTGTGAFEAFIESLSVNQIYYFKAYAENSAGTTLGTEYSFTTLANVPSAPTVGGATASSLNVSVNENGNPASTEFAIKVTYGATTKYVQSDGSLGDSEVWATDSSWGTKTVTGLAAGTEYTVSVAARNGANVATAYSTTASGTTLSSCDCLDTVTYTQQTGNYDAHWNDGTSGSYNGTGEMGMYANGDAAHVVEWKTFRTGSATSTDARPLQIGDEFIITVNTHGVYYGQLGVSFNDGHSTGSWDNRVSNSRFSIQQNGGNFGSGGGIGSWYVDDNDSDPSFSTTPAGSSAADYQIKVKITSSSTFNAEINSANKKYDLPMKGSPGATDRIDGYSIYLSDDRNKVWDQYSRQNSYWKQTATVKDTGAVEFGGNNNNTTIAGRIADGMGAACDAGSCVNKVYKIGTGTVTFSDSANSYSGGTEIQAGTLQVSADGNLGAAPGSADPDNLTLTSTGASVALVASETFTLNANRGITLAGNNHYLAAANTKTLTYNGVITDGSESRAIIKNQGGTLVLGGNNTYDGGTYIDDGTLTLAHANAAGTGGIYIGQDSGSFAATLNLGAAVTVANNLTVRTETTGIKYIKAAETATLSGAVAINESSDDLFNIDVASDKTLTLSGVISGSGGGEITKTGAGTLAMSNTGNTHDKKVTVTAGALSVSASRNLGADPGGAFAGKLTLDGGTLLATETFTMHANNSTVLGAGNGTISVNATKTLTYPAAISGSGTLTKSGTGTLILSGDNPYSGATTVSEGTLVVDNWTDDSAFTVALGAVLMGDSAVDALTVNGKVDPGTSAGARGTLSVDGAVTLNGGGSMQVDISNVGGTAGTDWDMISAGTITAPGSGQFTIYLNDEGDSVFSSASDYSWKIVDGSSVSGFDAGDFAVNTDNFSPALGGGAFSVTSSGGDLYLTFAAAVAEPASFSVAPASATSMTLTFGANAAGHSVVIISDADGSFEAPSGTPTVGNPLGGGTVVYIGTGSPQTHASLDSCTPYYYKAWSYYNGRYSSTGIEANGETDPPDAPATLWASATNLTSFTAAWSASAGATNYYIDVGTNATFSAGGGAANLIDTSFESTNGWSTHAYGTWTEVDSQGGSWTGSTVGVYATAPTYEGANKAQFDDSGDYLVLPAVNNPTNLSFWERVSSSTGNKLTIEWLDGSTWTEIAVITNTSTTYTERSIPLNLPGNDILLRLRQSAKYSVLYVDSLVVQGEGSVPSYVPGYENRLVGAGTSQAVTGLVSATTYYYRVRPQGDGECIGDDSSTANVTTLAGTATVALDDIDPQVTAGNVGAGATAHILHQFQLGVTVANATLTQVDFTTAGDYATADIANLKLRYSIDATLDETDATLDTIADPAAAGAKAFDSFSQVIPAPSTGYFFITADIAASPTYGHTISVNAITTGGLTFTDASKSGSTAAGGAQTIVANEPASHATAMLFTDVQTVQMTVSWANGGGENRIVVVKPGTSTSWTPSDGTAPSGVNVDFSAATDQGSGNKIVYSGLGTNVTITGLSVGTTYAVTVFEYNGTGTHVNYYTNGMPLSGTQMTACPAAPTGLYANPTNQFDFTAHWDSVSGAAGYVIDVSMTDFDAGGNGFQGFEDTANDMLPYTLGGSAVRSMGAKRTGAYSLLFGTTAASVTFGPVTLSGNSASTVTVAFAASGPDSGEDLYMSVCTYTGGVLSSNVTRLVDSPGSFTLDFDETTAATVSSNPYSEAVSATATQVYVVVWANGLDSTDFYYIDDVSLTGPEVGYVDGFQAHPVAGTSVEVTGLTDLVTYYWRVASTGAECTGDYSVVTNVTTLPGPPPKPAGLTATKGTETEYVALSWNNDSAKETAFLIYRHTLDDYSGAAPLWTNAANATTYNDTTAAVGTRYYYWVVASNAIGISAESDSDGGYRKLATVADLAASGCSDTAQVALSWTDVAGDTGYGIWRDTDSDPAGGDWVGTASANATTYNDITATPGTLYYYWVRATNATLGIQGDFHTSGAAGVRQLASVVVSASDDTDTGQVVVDWTDITGETGYTVWRSETDDTGTAEYLAHVAADGIALTEDFEDSWAEYPSGWSKDIVSGTTNWIRATGGQSSNPSGAHGGSYNARLYSTTRGYTNRLVTPEMDLSGYSSANVDFWHAQVAWSSDQDVLRVLYRTSAVASWVQLAEYTTSVTTWTERNLSLPNLSGSYYLAFEGVANYGYGVCLDDVAVTGQVSAVTSYSDEDVVAGTTYYYWVRGTNGTSGCQSAWGDGDDGRRKLVENPASAVLSRDGREMVRAVVAANVAGHDILVLHSTNDVVSGVPVMSSSYAVGNTLGNAKVVYKGAAGSFREHLVAPGTTNYYRVFSVESDTFYSGGMEPTGSPVETKLYQSNVVAETFSYTNVTLNTESFTNKSGGANWASASSWSLSQSGGASWLVLTNDTADGRPMFFTAASNMATLSGNRAFINLDGDNRSGTATRSITTTNQGSMYVSAIMAYRYEGDSEGSDRWQTIALMNGSTEEVEFGKVGGRWRKLDIYKGSAGMCNYDFNPYSASTDNWYWVVLKYDFDNDTAKLKAFHKGQDIPSTEPASWDLTWTSMSIALVDGIRLKAGSGAQWLGGALFDEVRVSSVWPALIGQPGMVVTPDHKDFGNVEVERTKMQTFWVENTGGDNVPLSVSSLTLTGATPTNFLLSTTSLGTIEYGQSNSFTVTFAPHDVGDFGATLQLGNTSDENPYLVLLEGVGIPSQMTNPPVVDDYWVGATNQVTDAMVTSGVFSVVVDVYHPAGIASASYDLLNSSGTVILTNQTFESWVSPNGEDYIFSNATHTGYWPATPADDYLLRVYLATSNSLASTNTLYGGAGSTESDDLFISEYLEGSSNNKAIEIYNGTGSSVDLSSYVVRLYNNGSSSVGNSIALSGTLAAGEVYVVANSSASGTILAKADLTSGSLGFNGNDVVALARNSVNIDVVGTIGSSAVFAEDVTKVRKSSVSDGVTTYATGEWDNYASDTTTYLGAHTMSGSGGNPMEFAVVDDDEDAPVITSPLVNGATPPDTSANGPSIAIGDVPAGGFDLDWNIQDTGSGVYAASNHYTLKRSNVVVSAGAVTAGSDGDGKGSALAVSTTLAKTNMIWGNYVLSLAGSDYDPEWADDPTGVSNVFYFAIAAPNIVLSTSTLNFGSVERDVASNLTVVVTNTGNADLVVSSIAFSGTGDGYFSVSPTAPTIAAGSTGTLTVTFQPAAGGTFNVTMTVNNNTPNTPAPTVAITAECFDPETAAPSIYDYRLEDSLAITNEVTDHALGNAGVTVGFTLWHYTGMKAAGATYDLLYPDGTFLVQNGSLDAMTSVEREGKTCYEFTATVPDALYPATLGVYTARVTAVSSNDLSVTDEAVYTPLNAGKGAAKVLDAFNRAYEVDNISEDWLEVLTGASSGNIQVTNEYLQFYGPGGTAGDGRLSVMRDVSARYNPVLTNNAGTLTWAFNFHSGQGTMTGLGAGKYAGLFVLGSDATNVVGGSGSGYAVRICSNTVALVRFTGGLNADGDATTIGMPASLASSTPMGIRVELNLATKTWSLYTTNWGGTGPGAFGSPLSAAELATATVDTNYLGSQSLKYAGCYWNHGSGSPSSTYGAAFDDVYVPYIMPASVPMSFTVYDEDEAGPVHSGFNVDGRQYTRGSINPGGLTVTGLVADANGVCAGTSNVWTLLSNSVTLATGSMTMTPNTFGAGTTLAPAALSATIAFSYLDVTNGTYVFRIVSTDYDVDREGDTTVSTNDYTFYIVDTEAPTPTDVTATADGMEMVEMTWNRNLAQGVVVLWSTNPITVASLPMGTAFNQGDDGPSGTKVLYHGTNDTGADLVVPEGAVSYFRVFGANGTIYSSGYADPGNSATTAVTCLEYEDGEICDQFAYTNSLYYTSPPPGDTNFVHVGGQPATGQGWNGGWTGDTDKWFIEDGSIPVGITMYPDPFANKLKWIDTSTTTEDSAQVTRKLANSRGESSKTFVAFMMNYQYQGIEKYMGLSLMSGTEAATEEIFFGKVNGQVNYAGISGPDFTEQASSYSLNEGHGNDYMIVGEWDPAMDTVRMWAFATNVIIPQEYTNALESVTVSYSNSELSVASITGIRLAAGSGDEGGACELGHLVFDEVRIGGTWDEVLNFNFPEAWNFSAGYKGADGTNYISDGQLSEAGKSYPVSYSLYHRTGVTNASFTIITNVNNLTGLYPSNIPLRLDPSDVTDKTRAFTNMVTNRLDPSEVTLGVYTSRVWMTSVSGKSTNTLYMEGRAGATDLFFGEFGEGQGHDKYVEIYNGTGSSVDLKDYVLANQTSESQKWISWSAHWPISATSFWLPHGETVVIVNGGTKGVADGVNTADPAMTNLLAQSGRLYLVSSRGVLDVGGDDPVALFHVSDTNTAWIDTCGIAPDFDGTKIEKFIMRRMEDAEVPLSYPTQVQTNQWDYRRWATNNDTASDRPLYTNFLATAGVYDRNVGLGGFITFTVFDDDTLPPAIGTANALMIGSSEPYTSLTPSEGAVEVVLTAWNFTGTNSATASIPWSGSLMTNGLVTCHPAYTPGAVDYTDSGTSENDMFGNYDSPNGGVAEIASIGTYFTEADTAWIQFEIELTSAENMVLTWAESGGSDGFDTAQLSWSSDGVNFNTDAAWPAWDPTPGNSVYVTRYAEFDGVVTPGLSKVYIRINLGPGYGGGSGFYRMDNVQLTGYPQEFQVTDGQIAASGNKLQFQGNLYDTNSGLDKAQAAMSLQGATGTRVAGKDTGDGTDSADTLWWELGLDGDDITDYVNASLTGYGMSINVSVPDQDADRTGDAAWLNGRIGQVRVTDDDTDRPRLSLTSMKPLSSIVAQWAQMTDTNSLLPTKSDASVDVAALWTKSGEDIPKIPTYSRQPTNGYHYIEAFAWHGQQKCWLVEMTPEADMAVTNLTFTSLMHRTNGVSHYRIDHYVDGVLKSHILGDTYWVDPPGMLDPEAWYTRSHGWATNQVVLEAGKANQIRLYGLGSSNIGARWRLSELTLWQAALSTNGVTEVTDAEFADGSFKLIGNAWDPDSGIVSTSNATASRRPMFSLSKPDGGVLVTNQLFLFNSPVADGGATGKEAGAFENPLPAPVYTNVQLGAYEGEAQVWDRDQDRTEDGLMLRGDLAMYLVDNDNAAPSAVGTVRVNGQPVGTPDRYAAPWTNQPDFIVSFDSVAVDQDPGDGYSAKQRAMSGIGEYRVTTVDVSAMAASNRAALGTPYPVATTNGSLANYGFEMGAVGWTLDGNSSIQALATGGTNLVREGTNSLKQVNGGVAYQMIEFRNLAKTAPLVGVSGWYHSETTPTFRVEAFTTNDLAMPVATSNLVLAAASSWTAFSGPTGALGNGTVEVLKVSLIDGLGNTTYWDDLRFHVDIGTNLPSMRFTATVDNQGITATNYLYAVDADNNRAGDRLAGPAVTFYTPYDITPPTVVAMPSGGTGASTENVDDPTTQFDLQWTSTGVGPDDPSRSDVYPSWGGTSRDLLSPWASYKIYYGTYVPEDGRPANFIYTNYVETQDYLGWPNVTASSTIEDPSKGTNNYLALTNPAQNKIRLYDLEFDQDYVVVVVGVDRAGNEGPAGNSSWATNNTIKFSLLRGLNMPRDAAEAAFGSVPSLGNTNSDTVAALYWTASGKPDAQGVYSNVSKDYDLISWDAASFEERTNNPWKLVGSVRTNWMVDDGGHYRSRGQLRFYRASYKDRWMRTNLLGQTQRPLVSEEIYALHNVVLSAGQNFVALHGAPFSNSFEAVFGGLDNFPGGSSASPENGSTVVEFYSPGTNAIVSQVYWLSTEGRWRRGGDNLDVTSVVQPDAFFTRGFSIHLPNPLPESYVRTTAWTDNGRTNPVPAMYWSPIVQVPTNNIGMTNQVIQTGWRSGRTVTNVYNLVALRLPVSAHPGQMQLLESGFVNGPATTSDQIYTIDSSTKGVLGGSTIYCDANGVWRFVSGNGLVPSGWFKPNDVIIIVSRNKPLPEKENPSGSGNWTWSYHPRNFYKLPTRWMEPGL